jgi:hypothetical protein
MAKMTLEEKLNLKIKISNEEFKKLTPREKRIAIAKDVIESLKKDQYRAKKGTYFVNNNSKANSGKELQRILVKGEESCTLCAMGGLLASKCKLGNGHVQIDAEAAGITYIIDSGIINSLKGIFSVKQLRMIEYAFEGQDVDDTFGDDLADVLLGEKDCPERSEIGKKCIEFYESYLETSERMVAIMKNIVKNKGMFKL